MRADTLTYEYLKIKVDQIADARGIIFSDKLHFVEKALSSLLIGQTLSIYCSDNYHKDEIPQWIKKHGHHYLGIIDEEGFFKILIQKGK
jgi:TusA-related sulfurtransferase